MLLLFVLDKTYSGAFLGIFRWGLDLFHLKIALCYAKNNLEVKKVSAPLEKSIDMPHSFIARERKKTSRTFRISNTLIVKSLKVKPT
jgi:hypothetical protein